MRIAMVCACPFPTPQGSQVFVRQMSERLVARGHEVHLLTYGQGYEARGLGFTHHRIRRLPGDDAKRSGPTLVKPVLDVLMVAHLDRLVAEHAFDVLHCHNYEGAIVGLAVRARRGVPVVYHSHNLMSEELGTYFRAGAPRRLAAAAGRLLDASVPRRADHTVALCEHTAAVLRARGVAEERISVVSAAADDSGSAMAKARARSSLGLEREGLLIGYCGNLDAYQNLETLVEAAGIVLARRSSPPGRLLVATHANDDRFRRLLVDSGLAGLTTVVEVDDYEQARVAMAAADVLVLPRRHGSGYPIKLLNYMCLGRAVVSAGCGAKILRDGVDGLVVADDDPAALATAIERLASDEALSARLGAAARQRFLASLTWDAVLPAIESVYGTVADAEAAPNRAHAV